MVTTYDAWDASLSRCLRKLPLILWAAIGLFFRKAVGHGVTSLFCGPAKAWNIFLMTNDDIPSGKLTVSYGKSQYFMGKSTINGHFQ
jgi:hypothetical protein